MNSRNTHHHDPPVPAAIQPAANRGDSPGEAGSTVVGSAVMGLGIDRGTRSMAIWHTDRGGHPSGAWVVPTEAALGTRDGARSVLARLEHRPITGESPTAIRDLLTRLCSVAEVEIDGDHVRRRTFCLLDAGEDTLARRVLVEMEIENMQARRSGVTAVAWRHGAGLSAPPRTTADLRRAAAVDVSGPSPLVTEVLGVVATLRWITEMWNETAAAIRRRPYLATRFGRGPELPTRWSTAAHTAAHHAFLPPTPRANPRRTS